MEMCVDVCWAWPRGQIFSMCIYESMYHGKSDSHLNVCGREKWGEEDGRYFIQRHFENDLQTQGRTRTSAYAHNTQNHGSSAFPVMWLWAQRQTSPHKSTGSKKHWILLHTDGPRAGNTDGHTHTHTHTHQHPSKSSLPWQRHQKQQLQSIWTDAASKSRDPPNCLVERYWSNVCQWSSVWY